MLTWCKCEQRSSESDYSKLTEKYGQSPLWNTVSSSRIHMQERLSQTGDVHKKT